LIARSRSSRTRGIFAACGAAGLSIALLAGVGSPANPAAAGIKGGGGGGGPCVEEFGLTGTTQTFQVPRGVDEITVDAFGAQGGDFADRGLEGLGAAVLGTTLPVSRGDEVEIVVGGRGADVGSAGPGGTGGFGGGGDGGSADTHAGAGGGGASTVLINGTPRVIAAGGGGASHGSNVQSADPTGGSGGDGGRNGEDGIGSTEDGNIDGFGRGATTTAGGAGGDLSGGGSGAGTAGSEGQGGTGGVAHSANGGDAGGGGGGGLFGGGGGGGGTLGDTASGSGGGGGSSLGRPGSTFQTGVREGDGRVTVTYPRIGCNPKLKLKKRTGKGEVRPGEVVPYRITVRNIGGAAARNVRVCDKLPSGLKLMRAPRGDRAGNRKVCWEVGALGSGQKRTLRVVAQVKTSMGDGSLTNRATAGGSNTNRTKSKEKVRVETAQDPCALGRIVARC
jgi:uncharacterized repeat protein (TIGR01451 family)